MIVCCVWPCWPSQVAASRSASLSRVCSLIYGVSPSPRRVPGQACPDVWLLQTEACGGCLPSPGAGAGKRPPGAPWILNRVSRLKERRKEKWGLGHQAQADVRWWLIQNYFNELQTSSNWWFWNSGLRVTSRSPKQYKGSLEVKTIYFPNTKML